MTGNKKSLPGISGQAWKVMDYTLRVLAEKVASTGALDRTGNLAVKLGRNTCHTAGKNLTGLGGEFLKEFNVFIVDLSLGDVVTTVRHWAVSLPECDAAFLVLRSRYCGHDGKYLVFEKRLAKLAVQCAAAKERIILHLFQTTWGIEALLVARGSVTGGGFPFRFCFGAFEDDDIACHDSR
jgi:hypothetical protein